MEALVTLGSFIALLTLFGIIAVVVGADTRDGFGDEPFRPRFS
jgi:hypothetical protein